MYISFEHSCFCSLVKMSSDELDAFSWNALQQTELIAAVKANPVVWDVSSAEYKATGNKLPIWEAIANSVSGKPNVLGCKRKWKALRVQYARILKTRKLKKCRQTPNGDNAKVTWRYFEGMNFLRNAYINAADETEPLGFGVAANEDGRFASTKSMTSAATTSSSIRAAKIRKRKRRELKRDLSDNETVVVKIPAAVEAQQTSQQQQQYCQQQPLQDEHQRFGDMIADELRRAHARNSEGAHQLRRILLTTVTNFWENEPTRYMEMISNPRRLALHLDNDDSGHSVVNTMIKTESNDI